MSLSLDPTRTELPTVAAESAGLMNFPRSFATSIVLAKRSASVSWRDDAWQTHWAWIPAANVRRLTESEWDIIEYHRCPENLRGIKWGSRLPGFLPA